VEQQRDSPLIGSPDEILAKLQALSAAGVEYLMLNAAGSRASLRRFARDVMPHVDCNSAELRRPVDSGRSHSRETSRESGVSS
jgi:alkanesulfonate monooxygenase SsuD/methylene tetrahydromethanopterin reductase-like flavin-dependent oxidoreductase (luciferase family)